MIRVFGVDPSWIVIPLFILVKKIIPWYLIFVFNTLANERYVCGNSSSCNFKCSKWTELQLHIKTEHPPICVGCDKKFTTKDGLKKHLRNTGHDGGVESKNYLIKKFIAEQKRIVLMVTKRKKI